MRFKAFSGYYNVLSNGELVMYFAGRSEDRQRRILKVRGTEPAFFVPTEYPIVANESMVRVDENWGHALDGRPVHRIVAKYPYHVPRLRELYPESFEGDIVYDLRCAVEVGMKDVVEVPDSEYVTIPEINPLPQGTVHIPPRKFTIDIETDDRGSFGGAADPKAQVISIAIHDSETNRYVVFFNGALSEEDKRKCVVFFHEKGWNVQVVECRDEADLFAQFARFMDGVGPDVCVGWNYCQGKLDKQTPFDLPYLKNRSERKGYQAPNWKASAHFDLMGAYVKMERLSGGDIPNWNLQYVACEREKVGSKLKRRSIWWMYEHDRATLVCYNVMDVHLTKEVDSKRGITDFYLEVAALAGMTLGHGDGEIMAETRITDAFFLHRLRPRRIVQKTNEYSSANVGGDEGEVEEVRGGKVRDTIFGLHKDVIEVDNSGEYPAVVRTFNLSPEMIVGPEYVGPTFVMCDHKHDDNEPCNQNGRRYRADVRGLMPEACDDLSSARAVKQALKKDAEKAGDKELEKRYDRQQNALKSIGNSVYGCSASLYWRNRHPGVANDITGFARYHVKWNCEFVEKKEGIVVLSDTDSSLGKYLQTKGLSYEEKKVFANAIVDEMNASYDDMVRPFGATAHFFKVKLEHIYDAMLIVNSKTKGRAAKKRYACIYRSEHGDLEHNGIRYSLKVRGFEMRKSNTAPLTAKLQEEVITKALLAMLDENTDQKKLANDILGHIRNTVKRLQTGEISPLECRIPTAWKQETYKTTPPEVVRAAQWSNAHLGKTFKAGDKPCLLYGRIAGKPQTPFFAVDWDDELPPGTTIDINRTVERVILMPLETILQVIGINPQHILQPQDSIPETF